MMPEHKRIDFYFDFVSPYAYLGWRLLRLHQEDYSYLIEAKPVLFAGLLNAHGTLGPAEVAAKRQFVFKDSLRKATLLKIPLNPPFGHPFNPLLALRLTLATPTQYQPALVDQLYRATWELGVEVSAEKSLRNFTKNIDLPAHVLETAWEKVETEEVKLVLRTNTCKAVERGVFGVPTFILNDDLFWGVDNFAHVEAVLRGQELITDKQVADWKSVRPLAHRKRA